MTGQEDTRDPVAALIAARRRDASRPGARRDPHRLALVIEGGGMRGVIAGGMVSALEHLGLVEVFDAVYGTSAGACAGAWLLAGQAVQGTRIFFEDINNPRFIRLGRALIRRPVLNTDYLIDHVLTELRPFDVARFLDAPIPLTMMATDVETGRPVALRDFRDVAAVMAALKATTRLPLVGGRPVPGPDGRLLVDGALTAPLPIDIAEADGASHILVLSTRPDVTPLDGGPSRGWFARLLARHVSPAVAQAYLDRPRVHAALLDRLREPPQPGRAFISVVRPAGRGRKVGKTERRRPRLVGGAEAGWRAMMRWLDLAMPSPFRRKRIFARKGQG